MFNIQNFIQNFFMIEEVEIFLKLLLITILAGILGYERQTLKKPAGLKTYILVGISSSLVMICGIKVAQVFGTDPARIPAQLLSGIGFLGAGTILKDGNNNVKGLTTAAGLFAVACIGLVVGAGFYAAGIIATVIVFCLLSYSSRFSVKNDENIVDLKIMSFNLKATLNELKELLNKEKLEIVHIKLIDNDDEKSHIRLKTKIKSRVHKNMTNEIISRILDLDDVNEVIKIEDDD